MSVKIPGLKELIILHIIISISLYFNDYEPNLRYVLSFLAAVAISMKGYRKKSLSLSGAIAAFFVGLITLGSSYRFGITLLNFYITSSKLTKLKEK